MNGRDYAVRALRPDEIELTARPDIYAEIRGIGRFDPAFWAAGWRRGLASGAGTVLGLFDAGGRLRGAIGWAESQDLFTGNLIFEESFWYLDRELRGHGLAERLWQALEARAAADGAVLVMAAPATEAGARLAERYRSRGYEPRQTQYAKEMP